jgi:hypothetical protein
MDKPPIVPRSPLNFDMSDDALELKFKQVSSHPMHVAKIICLKNQGPRAQPPLLPIGR